jgi:hypothetical protein
MVSAYDLQGKKYLTEYNKAKDSDSRSGKKTSKSDIHFGVSISLAHDLANILNANPNKVLEIISEIKKKQENK